MNSDLITKSFDCLEDDIKNLRFKVFVEEYKIPIDIEIDDLENASTHVGLYLLGNLIGCGRIVPNGTSCSLGRIAVKKEYRGLGYGKYLILQMIDIAKKSFSTITPHSMEKVIGFYESCGFKTNGPIFYEAGIPHCEMLFID